MAGCSRCARRLSPGLPCSACRRLPGFFPAASWARYAPPLDRILTHLKYRPDLDIAERLAGHLEEVYRAAAWTATCVVPVPLGGARRRRRGYNQVGLIAQALGKHLDMPVPTSALVRIRETDSQVGLTPIERQRNVSGAFAADATRIRGQSPLLLDDVFTPGATLAACADALRRAGASQVFGLTVARA